MTLLDSSMALVTLATLFRGEEGATLTAAGRPRAAVIADAWASAGIDAPAFVNRAGIPLARTTKCLLDPLVIRPRLHRNLAPAILGDADAEQIAQLFAEAAPAIEDASSWYLLLRAERDSQGITEGNPQELYFPRAFELAVTRGAPGADSGDAVAETLAEIHDLSQASLEDLAALLADPARESEIRRAWDAEWAEAEEEVDVASVASAIDAALHEPDSQALEDLLAGDDGTRVGLAMRTEAGLISRLLAEAGLPRSLRLSLHDPLLPPAVRGQASLPLERTLEQRARAALRRHRETFAPIGASELLEDEADRVLAAFGLAGADTQALFLAGIVVAAGLDPLGHEVVSPIARPRLVGELQARLRKEAYVMHLRRELAAGRAIHPQQERVVAELAEFWRPWLTRLWVRLHGRDVTRTPVADEAAELLTGITRSVMLDHRQQIRGALEKAVG